MILVVGYNFRPSLASHSRYNNFLQSFIVCENIGCRNLGVSSSHASFWRLGVENGWISDILLDKELQSSKIYRLARAFTFREDVLPHPFRLPWRRKTSTRSLRQVSSSFWRFQDIEQERVEISAIWTSRNFLRKKALLNSSSFHPKLRKTRHHSMLRGKPSPPVD